MWCGAPLCHCAILPCDTLTHVCEQRKSTSRGRPRRWASGRQRGLWPADNESHRCRRTTDPTDDGGEVEKHNVASDPLVTPAEFVQRSIKEMDVCLHPLLSRRIDADPAQTRRRPGADPAQTRRRPGADDLIVLKCASSTLQADM